MDDLPEGFEPLFRTSPFLDRIGPFYNKRSGNELIVGFRVLPHHCNGRGLLHGGVISSLADVSLGYSALLSKDKPVPLITANLSVDYAGAASEGEWVEISTDVQKVGRRVAFANCYFTVGSKRIARASAVFSVADA